MQNREKLTFVITCPYPVGRKPIKRKAGLLTYSYLKAFPVNTSGKEYSDNKPH